MLSKCCSQPKPDYKELSAEEYQKFCLLVHRLRKKGYNLEEAQSKAYHQVVADSIPFEH